MPPPLPTAVPFLLMPIAAGLGMYALYVIGYALYVIGMNWKQSREQSVDDPKQKRRTTARERLEKGKNTSQDVIKIQSNEFALMLFSLLLALIAYSFLVARVQAAYDRAEYYSFDPYAILGLEKTAELEVELLQTTFKEKIQEIRSKTADADALEQVKLAYQALADERGKLSYERFGHPLGQLEVPAFCMTVPAWLLSPTGPYATVVYFVYIVAALALVATTAQAAYQARENAKKAAAAAAQKPDPSALLDDSNSVGQDDLRFILDHLKPTSQYFDVLATICAAPENVAWSLRDLNKVTQIREDRLQQEEEEKLKKSGGGKKANDLDFDALVNEGGWDDDEDEGKGAGGDEAKKDKEKEAGGPPKILLEGLDDGVLGQKWVENTLAKADAWPPPKADILDKESFEYNGETLDALDHPGLRRMLCMTMGRLNSAMLNSHPELLDAGAKKLIDQTYFKASMEFRQRVGLRLEATLRLGMTMRSFRLIETTVESVAHFKIGCSKGDRSKQAFQNMMKRQFDCLPELKVHSSAVVNADGEKEVATGDKVSFELEAERMHAEKFLRSKINQCQKQGIPPQVALQGFREGWWMILRYQRLDGPTPDITIDRDNQLFKTLDPPISQETLDAFDKEDAEHRLIVATPALVANIAQKTGKFQLKFAAPSAPGKYRFILSIKSQDYLGCDQEVRVDANVVDGATVKREPKKEKEEGDAEPKKEK